MSKFIVQDELERLNEGVRLGNKANAHLSLQLFNAERKLAEIAEYVKRIDIVGPADKAFILAEVGRIIRGEE